MNEILWFLFMLLDFSIVILIFRLFRKEGLYAMIVMSIIVCNIQVVKIVKLLGMTATLGNVLYGSIFFSTDLLSEVYGRKDAKKGVMMGFFTLIVMMIYMKIALIFKPDPSDFSQPHLEGIFNVMPRIVIASLTAYIVSQLHDVWAFHFWKSRTKGRFLWLRNNFSTMVSQFIDSVIFCSIAFMGLFSPRTWWDILLTTYILKFLVALFDTPFIYVGRYMAE
ncbi:MAG: VUT family protein, partial [Thermotoga sp.]